ncbi:unnamed protein product [Strongylus vulgaris]|uniref:Uncharacterized protein n=1 Tax=Strongylus vulgaris TaxID=40348 RepID=A0A3P7JFL8_STRVU|nr:unnamed protein product [Strongylus vulgaris]
MAGGPTTYFWIGLNLLGSLIAFVGITFIIKHTSNILKDHAKFSQSSRDMHRSAITGLVIQSVAVLSSTIVPMIILSHIVLFPPSSITFISHYGTCATLLFSLKSFNATVSMICTTVPYRNNFVGITGVNYMLSRYGRGKVVPENKDPTRVSSSAAINTQK